MGAYKRLNYRMRVLRWWPTKAEAIHLGIDLPLGGELPPEEERRDAAEAKRERLAERKARAAVDREDARAARKAEKLAKAEAKAQAAALKAAKAAEPRTFAAPAPDFTRSTSSTAIAEASIEHVGLASPLQVMAAVYRRDKRSLEQQLGGELSPGMQELRRSSGPPEPPARNTGYYMINGDAYARVGSWPFPEYRPPGLAWRLHWLTPKPDDVPWEDEVGADVEVASVVLRCDEPEPTPPRPMGGKIQQAMFAW